MPVTASNLAWTTDMLARRVGAPYVYGGVLSPTNTRQGCDCSALAAHALNAVLFGPPGHLYVYFTYGMHFCSNVACERDGVAGGVLLRALEPRQGHELMAARRGLSEPRLLCSGPARLAQALAIGREHNGLPVWRDPLAILARPDEDDPEVVATPRIGVGGDDKPWRFVDAHSAFLSRRLPRGR